MSFAPIRWLRTGKPRWKILATSLSSLALISAVVAGAVLTTYKAKADTLTATASLDWSWHGYTSPVSVGVNDAAWDSNMTDSSFPGLLNQAGVQIIRYPGGSTADNFNWYNQSVSNPGSTGAPGSGDLGPNCDSACGVNFDQFMSVAQQAGAQAMITVNSASLDRVAANWVSYANKNMQGYFNNPDLDISPSYAGASPNGHAYGIHYWEIGNEVYGDGSYYNGSSGSDWEASTRCSDFYQGLTNCGPAAYANTVNDFSQQMKAVDPSIAVGAVLTAPGNWPDNLTSQPNPLPGSGATRGTNYGGTWDDIVLKQACQSIDFVDVHWYPQAPSGSGNGGESDSQLLSSVQNGITDHGRTPSIASMVQTLRNRINNDCGANAGNIQIMVTETNSVYSNPGRQTTSIVNALFEDDDIMTWLENGVSNVDWWAAHNSPSDGNSIDYLTGNPLYGFNNYGDYGLLSRGMPIPGEAAVEPPAETPFPDYYGMQMLTYLISGPVPSAWSQAFAGVWTSTSMISAHAVNQNLYEPDSGVSAENTNVLFINKDPANSYTTTLSLAFPSDGSGWFNDSSPFTVYSYRENNSYITQSTVNPSGNSVTVTLPPYSLTVVNVQGGWSCC